MDDNNGKISFAVSLSLDELEAAVQKGKGQIRSLADTAEREGDRIDDLTKRIGRAAAGIFSIGMAQQFARQVVQTRGQIQQLEIAFRTLTKSQEKADELMNQLIDTAAKTPFDLMGIADSAKFLLGIRVPVEEVNDTLKMLGDIAAGVGAPLKDIAYLYGTTITKAHMDTMDLRQFTGRGIDLIGELSKQYGIATDQVQQYVAAGKVGAEDLKKAINSIRETTFNNLMEEQSKSLTGQIANLGDSIDMMMNEIGKKTQGIASGAINVAATLVENYEKVGDAIYALITAYGMYRGAQLAAIAAEKTAIMWRHRHALAIVTLKRAQEALNKSILTNPYALAGAAIIGLTAAIVRYKVGAVDAEKATGDFAEANKELTDRIEEQRSKADELVATIRDDNETTFAKQKAYEDLLKLYPDLLGKIDLETLKTMKLTEAKKLLNKERDKALLAEKKEAVKQAQQELASYKAPDVIDPSKGWKEGFKQAGKTLVKFWDHVVGEADNKITYLEERVRLAQEDLAKTTKELEQATEEETTEEENGHVLTDEELKKLEEARKRAEKEAKERADAQRQLTEKVIQADFDLRQARIEAMDEGVEREFAANKLAHDRLMHQIDLQAEEWIETCRKATGAKTATFESLSKDQQSTILSMQAEADRAYWRADERALEQALNGIRTYEQEIEKAKEDFRRKRKALRKADGSLADGVTEENIRELERQEKEVLTGIDEQFAKREQTYTAFLNRISNLGLEALRQALEEAKQALEEAEANGVSGSKLAETRARVKAVTDQITKVESNSGEGEVRDALADWQKLYETLGRVKQSFDDIGESLGGVAGTAIKTAGSIAASAMQMINGITTLANWSIRAQEMTAKGASRAVQSVERASVVLAVVGAALQVITKVREVVTSFIDEGREADREAIKFAGSVQTLNSELEVTRDKALAASRALHIFSGNGFADAQRSVKLAESAFKRYNAVLREQVAETEEINRRMGGSLLGSLFGATRLDDLQDDAQKYGRIIGDLQIQTRKATGFDFGPFHIGKRAKYQSLRDLVPELFDPDESINKDALAKFIGTEVYDKLPDKVKASLTEVKRAQEEFAEQTKELEGYLRGVFGDLGNDLMTDIVDAFRSGEDASDRFAKSVSKTLEKLVSNMIFSSVFADTFKRAEGEMKALMSKGASQEEFIDFYSQLMAQVKALKGQADKQLEDAKRAGAEKGLNLFTPDDSKSGERREASRKGLAQASQDSIDELSGRATAIQGHTYDISTYTRQLVTTSGAILGRVTEIRDNTNRLERIEGATDKLRRSMDEITIKGIKVRS